jgi:hypothetical protein
VRVAIIIAKAIVIVRSVAIAIAIAIAIVMRAGPSSSLRYSTNRAVCLREEGWG